MRNISLRNRDVVGVNIPRIFGGFVIKIAISVWRQAHRHEGVLPGRKITPSVCDFDKVHAAIFEKPVFAALREWLVLLLDRAIQAHAR